MVRFSPKAVFVVLLVGVAACSSRKPTTPEEVFAKAERFFADGAYDLAVETYRELLDQHPFSDFATEAELRIAHAHYLDGDYVEAVAALTDFQRRHPTSPALPMVGYLLGMCHKKRMRSPDRDQSAAREAEEQFLAVIQQYPTSPFAELARRELADCQKNLAAQELYVAKFYLRKGNRLAAERRLLEVVRRYPYTDLCAEALYRLGELYRSSRKERAALAYQAVLQGYARTRWAGKARRRLDELGVPAVAEDARAELLAHAGVPAPGS
ncbi:MAG: outer membrane protein assembly factor BamD [Candidatus Binatia bacterium]|nr:MAG: outer membrane protein assembly factor BamD [Candidatus Binatia bacterium]